MNDTHNAGMTVIVKTITRLTTGFILLYGINIALSGHSSPGGGFVGGVVLSLLFIHIMLAFGKEAALKKLHGSFLRMVMSMAIILFLLSVAANFRKSHPFIKMLLSDGVFLPMCEMLIVASAISLMFTTLVVLCKKDG